MQDYHPDAYGEIVPSSSKVSKPKQKQPTLQQVISKTKKYDTKSTCACELNKAVAYYLSKDMQPLYAVERPGFKKLVAKLDPKYTLPSRNYFSETEIPRLQFSKATANGSKILLFNHALIYGLAVLINHISA